MYNATYTYIQLQQYHGGWLRLASRKAIFIAKKTVEKCEITEFHSFFSALSFSLSLNFARYANTLCAKWQLNDIKLFIISYLDKMFGNFFEFFPSLFLFLFLFCFVFGCCSFVRNPR